MKHLFFGAIVSLACVCLMSCDDDEEKYADLAVDKTSVTVEEGQTTSFEITSGSGSYAVSVKDAAIATASQDGIAVTVTGVAEGATEALVKDELSGQSLIVGVTVTAKPVAELKLDKEAVTLEVGATDQVKIVSGSGEYAVSVAEEGIVSATLEEAVVMLEGLSTGSTKVWVEDKQSGNMAEIAVEVAVQPVITFHSAYKNNVSFVIDAPEEARPYIWVDVNGNGKKDEGEQVTKFGERAEYPVKGDVAVYGAVAVFEAPQMLIDVVDVSKSPQLRKLNLEINKIANIDLSNNVELEELDLDYNRELRSVDVSTLSKLKKISCNGNTMSTIDLSNNPELEEVLAIASKLESINLGTISKVTKLDIWNNNFTEIDLSHLQELTYLNLYGCELASLDVSVNTKLEVFNVGSNPFKSLDLSKNTNLVELYIPKSNFENDVLASIPAPEKVEIIQFFGGQLSSADFTKFTSIKTLYVYSNNIKEAEMTKLVESLPARQQADEAKIYIKDSSRMPGVVEGNEVTDAHVKACRAKKWTPYDQNTGASPIPLR